MSQPFTLTMVNSGLAESLTALVAHAAAAILSIDAASLTVENKPDQSPVTAADRASDAVLAEGLNRLLPGMPVISEERSGRPSAIPADSSFALVDPLDGTKEFLAGRDEFTVNLAIISQRQPIAGFIAVPAQGLVFRGIAGRGAERIVCRGPDDLRPPEPIRTRKAPVNGLVATQSRSHLDAATAAFLDRLSVARRVACGSALKFCRIAEGSADIYPRLARTFEWDIAAGHALVVAAGGVVTSAVGQPLFYGRAEDEFAVSDFVAWGDPECARQRR